MRSYTKPRWQRREQPGRLDLPVGPDADVPAPTTCAMCEQPARLLQMVGSAVAFCSPCFEQVYALPR